MLVSSACDDLAGLERMTSLLRSRQRTIVLTTGVWDILHSGHIRYLEDAARQGDELFVGVDADELVRQAKGPNRPILDQEERRMVVAALHMVRWAFVFDNLAPVIKVIRPDVLVVSPTTKEQADWVWDREALAREARTRIVVVQSRSQTHTTDIVQTVLERFGPK
jgi:rfaE bifunctional protein nucleotidyltransferase chain/domain